MLFLLSRPYNEMCGAWIGKGRVAYSGHSSFSCLDHAMECGCNNYCPCTVQVSSVQFKIAMSEVQQRTTVSFCPNLIGDQQELLQDTVGVSTP